MHGNFTRSLFESRTQAWLALLILASTLALFSPAMRYEFVGLDDEAYVSENPMTRDGFSTASLAWAWTARVVGHWAPVLWMSYMLDGSLFGPAPWGFHLTNILLHAVNTMLVFVLLRGWTGRTWAACWGALFWAWHPLRVESVAWIAERKDVLSGLFFLLCLLAYTRGFLVRAGLRWRIGVPALLLGLGLLVKPVLITVPFVLLLVDAWPLRRMGDTWAEMRRALPALVLEKWPLWLLSLSLGTTSWLVNAASGIPHQHMPPLGQRLLLIPGNYLTYLRQTLWPELLSVLYPRPVFSAWIGATAVVLLAGLTVAAWVARRMRPALLVGWLWFLGMLVPSIGFIWMGTTEGAGDRFTYLPAIGLSLMAAAWAPAGPRARRWVALAGAASLLAAGLLTARQLPVWRNSGTLFGRVLAVDPGNLQANLNYGIWLWHHGSEAAAQEHYRRAFARSARGPETIGEAGYAWALQGRAREAQALLQPALDDPRTTPLIHGAYGMACLHTGDVDAAIRHFRRAIALHPQEREFRVELIRASFEAGDAEEARQQAALLTGWPGGEIRSPSDLFAFYVQRWRNGERSYAWGYFERLLAETPESVPLLNNVAWLAATDRDAAPGIRTAALDYARRAARLTEGRHAGVLDTLAAALANAGDFDAAVATAEKARQLAERDRDLDLASAIERRMNHYRRGLPWRP